MSGFSRNARLTSRRDFQVVFDNPRKITRSHWQVLYKSNTLSYPRLGIIISKRFARHAVVRNRLRRVVRESFRWQQAKIPAVDIVLIARTGCAASDNQTVRNEIDNVWQLIKA